MAPTTETPLCKQTIWRIQRPSENDDKITLFLARNMRVNYSYWGSIIHVIEILVSAFTFATFEQELSPEKVHTQETIMYYSL